MDNFKNDAQNKQDSRELRDNFKNIQEFMNAQGYEYKDTDDEQMQQNRDLRDNFKNVQEFVSVIDSAERKENRSAGSD